MNDNIFLLHDAARVMAEEGGVVALARRVLPHVFRVSLEGPGFALIDLGNALSPVQFRTTLVALADGLAAAYGERFGRSFALRSLGRFDQKRSTEAHLDGGPEESALILGYEPTEIASRLFLLDYSRAAVDRSMEPKAFLERFNPTLGGQKVLAGYIAEAVPFDRTHYRVAIINNCCAPYQQRASGSLGVLHQGNVEVAIPGQTRWVNTMMLYPPSAATSESTASITADDVRTFVDTGAYQSI